MTDICVYCMIADWANHWMRGPHTPTTPTPPWSPWVPQVPPAVPPVEWTREQYDGLIDILQRVKEMEDRLGGCPCEDERKMDFLKVIKERIEALEQKVDRDDGKPIQYGWPEDNE